jgi:elongation factor P--(R)-beta-lysine ligase
MTGNDAIRWQKPGRDGVSRADILRKRQAITRAVRAYMDGEGFLEIDAPLLVHGTTPDAGINSFRCEDRYLVTSTEHQIKRLESGGVEKIYTLTKNFRRADGDGPTHNPEFTMLEWNRVGADMKVIEDDAAQIVLAGHHALGGKGKVAYKGHNIDLALPWPRVTVIDAVEQYTGVRLKDFELASVRKAVEAAGITIHADWANDRTFLFSVLVDWLQERLGLEKPVFLCDWPNFMTSMALDKPGTNIADRSELYICGLELSNGFPSLTDYDSQKKGFAEQIERRRVEGKEQVEVDEAYLEALKTGMKPSSGMAMGFDRLVMILTGQSDIRATLAFAWDEV